MVPTMIDLQMQLAELLVFHSIIKEPDDLNLKNQTEMIKSFQSKFSLPVDGILNPDTLWALQENYVLENPKLKIVEIETDHIESARALKTVTFREDAGILFKDLQTEVKNRGGLISCSAGIRDIKMVAGTGQSPTSMHYPGLAFDLNIKAGFFNPDKDLYVLTRVPTPHKKDPNRYQWNVFCRSEQGEEMELDANYWETEKSGVDLKKTVVGRFINFTELAINHGFQPIRPQTCFTRPTNRFYICSEWWHFQANALLIPKFSQLGMELLKIEGYTPEFLQKNNPGVWTSRKFVYFQNWW